MILQKIATNELYNSHVWHRLLHLDQKEKPLINTSSFLLSQKNFTPKNEMINTINSFFEDSQSICKYPARYYWLKNELHLKETDLPTAECKELDEYLENTRPNNLKLVFVSEQVKSPSSMMGHTFFKLEGLDDSNQSKEHAVSFFTIIDTFNIPLLILKSTVTGMKGYFTLSPYKEQAKRYLKTEQRNIWEYDLNLNNYQQKIIYYHFWELKDVDMEYLFINYNCANVVEDMLAITNKDYYNNESLWTTPKDVIKRAFSKKLIHKAILKPSSDWELNMFYESIPHDKISEIQNYFLEHKLEAIDRFAFSKDEKMSHLEKSFIGVYADFLNDLGSLSDEEVITLKRSLSNQEEYYIDLSKYKNPIKTFDDTQFAIGYQRSSQKEGIKLGFLPASNTLYDDNREYFSESSLKIGEFTLLLQPDAVEIDSASIFAMQSLIPWNSLTKSLSSDFKLNYEKQYTEKLNEYHAFNLSGGIGISKKIHEDVMLFGLLDVGLSYGNNHLYPYLYPHLGLMIYEVFNMKSVFEYQYFYNQNNSHTGYHNFNIEQSVFLDKKYRIGLNYNHKNSALNSLNSFGISFNYFF